MNKLARQKTTPPWYKNCLPLHEVTKKENRPLYQYILTGANFSSPTLPLFSMCVGEMKGSSLSVRKLHVVAVVGNLTG